MKARRLSVLAQLVRAKGTSLIPWWRRLLFFTFLLIAATLAGVAVTCTGELLGWNRDLTRWLAASVWVGVFVLIFTKVRLR